MGAKDALMQLFVHIDCVDLRAVLLSILCPTIHLCSPVSLVIFFGADTLVPLTS